MAFFGGGEEGREGGGDEGGRGDGGMEGKRAKKTIRPAVLKF